MGWQRLKPTVADASGGTTEVVPRYGKFVARIRVTKNKRRWIRPFPAILHRYRLLRRLQRLDVKTDSGGNALWQKAYGNPNYAATFQKVGLTSDGGFVSGEWTLEFNNQNEAYIVKTDSGGDVNNCSDVQVTTATAGSLSETASLAKLSITVPLRGSYRDNRERSRAGRAS